MTALAPLLLLFASLAPSACYRTEEIAFDSDQAGVRIAGDLTIPAGKGPFPAVQLITGNGPHTRDQLVSKTPMFRQLAEHLAKRGVAVLRTDARGFGGSSGAADDEAHTTAERATDNRAGLRFLQGRPEVDARRVGLLGHSEGAMIAVMLAVDPGADSTPPALVALVAPSTLPGREVKARQMSENLRRRGADEATAAAVHAQLLRFFDFLVRDGGNNAEFAAIANDFLAAHGVAREEIDPKFAQGLLSGFLDSRWVRFFVGYDPGPDLRRVHAPIAAFFAGADANVPWRTHMPALAAAAAASGNERVDLHVLPDQDHFFLEHDGRRVEKHVPGRMQLAPELLEALDAALARHGLSGTACTR